MKKSLRGSVILLLGFAGCHHLPRSQSEPTAPSNSLASINFPIIDAHIHTRFTGNPHPVSEIPMTLESLEKDMAESGVKGVVSHTGANGKGYVALPQMQIIQCYGLSAKVNAQHLEEALRSKKYRCIKIYLGYVYQYAWDPEYKKAYQLAEKYNVPVVFHTGDTATPDGKLKYSDPLTIDEVAVDFRKVKFVIAHCGNPWIQSAAEIAYKNPNVYLDGSALLVGDFSQIDPKTIDQYAVEPLVWVFGYIENPKKLMFATDWPYMHMKPYVEAFKKAIPPQHWRAVFYENARDVFNFPDLETNLK